jgi:hypothetical protein
MRRHSAAQLSHNHKQNENMTHTHSPWHLGKRAGNPAIYGKDGTEIAEILQGLTPEWRENARLIAAAPEMLAALKELLADKYLADPINADRMAKTRAAIAKAEGNA